MVLDLKRVVEEDLETQNYVPEFDDNQEEYNPTIYNRLMDIWIDIVNYVYSWEIWYVDVNLMKQKVIWFLDNAALSISVRSSNRDFTSCVNNVCRSTIFFYS